MRIVASATGASAVSGVLPLGSIFATENRPPARHYPARVNSAPEVAVPSGKRTPFGWSTVAIAATPLVLGWPDFPSDLRSSHLRLGVALDVRDEKLIEAVLPQSGRVVGVFDVRYASLLQVFEIPLAPADAEAIVTEGVALRTIQGVPLRVFGEDNRVPQELRPHLLVPGAAGPTAEFFERMGSLASVQPWSWNEGCVLDGLLDLAEFPQHSALKETARRHLGLFLRDGKLVYEDPVSVPCDGNVYGIEGTLPFAALAKLEPSHPILETALTFWFTHRDARNVIIDGNKTSSEGAYTVGYPLAVIGRQRNDAMLQKLALDQLRGRQVRLFDGETFWRTSYPGNSKGNRNWARGVAWQLLGMARTLRELKAHPDAAAEIESFQMLSKWILRFQRQDGLWSVFVDKPSLLPDTAGSAGIAAALAIGVQEGWLGANFRVAAERCLAELKTHLTADGFLGGVSQSNRGGEALQRGNYRVIYQMAMGLLAQLMAALASA